MGLNGHAGVQRWRQPPAGYRCLAWTLAACTQPAPVALLVGEVEEADERLLLSPVQECDSPRAIRYREVGGVWGLAGHSDARADHLNGGGLVLDDLDGDEDLDVMVFFDADSPVLYRNDGGVLSRDPQPLPALYGGPSATDIDADGHLDILLGGGALMMGDGQGFYDIVALDIREWEGGYGFVELLPDDIDGDGVVDLLALRTDPGEGEAELRDVILWGDGGGSFTAESNALPLPIAAGKAFDARAFDWDGDGDRDYYVVNDMGSEFVPDVLWRNDGGTLSDASAACGCGLEILGMGVSLADYDADGQADLYLTGAGRNVLLRGLPDGTFVDTTLVTGADPMSGGHEMSWGSAFVDHDNDGDEDIVVLQGDLWTWEAADELAYDGPIHLMEQDGGVFSDVSPDLGMTKTGSYRAVVAADLNADGVQDLVITDVVERPLIYLSQGCTEAGWLAVHAPEHSAVALEIDGEVRTITISRDPGFSAVGPPIAWFGLGEAQRVDLLTVSLPDGQQHSASNLSGRRSVWVRP